MNGTRPEGNQGRAMVCQDLLDPNDPRGAFGAEHLNLTQEKIAQTFPGVEVRRKTQSIPKH